MDFLSKLHRYVELEETSFFEEKCVCLVLGGKLFLWKRISKIFCGFKDFLRILWKKIVHLFNSLGGVTTNIR